MIRFKKIDDLNYLESIVFPQFRKVLDENDDKHIALEEDCDRQDVLLMFFEPEKIKKIIDVCQSEDIIIGHRDLTEELMANNVTEKIIIEMIKSDEYSHLFQRFLESTKFRFSMS